MQSPKPKEPDLLGVGHLTTELLHVWSATHLLAHVQIFGRERWGREILICEAVSEPTSIADGFFLKGGLPFR